MAKKAPVQEGFGQADGSPLISPLSYQNTFEGSVDSLHDLKPVPESYNPPMDPLGIAKERK